MQAFISLPRCSATAEAMEDAEGALAHSAQPAQGSMLLFVHAAGHEEALQVLQHAEAKHGIAVRSRCATPCSLCHHLTDTCMSRSHMFRQDGDAGRSSDDERAMMGCRYDLQRLEVKGTLSDRAVASALSLADLAWPHKLPEMPKALRPQPSEGLFKLLQATGARQHFSCSPDILLILPGTLSPTQDKSSWAQV